MNDLFAKGYAKEVSHEEMEGKHGEVWYLPHHPVINPQKEKVRIVFDCAAKYNGVSLNSRVLQGPDLANKLVGVLIRFRLEEVALMADIEAMFHQVKVSPCDQDVLRFLWWPEGDTTQKPQVCKMIVHLFGGTWSPSCCNYALHKMVKDHGDDFTESTKKTVLHNFYVDDCLKSIPTVEDATKLTMDLKELLKRGGFNLTKWLSNKKKVLDAVPEDDQSKRLKDLALDTPVVERALGVFWNVDEDTFSYKMTNKCKPLTKRGLRTEYPEFCI